MDESTARTQVQELIGSIHQQPGWYDGIDVGRRSQLFGRTLSAVALLSTSETPEYVTGAFNREAGTGWLHVFYARTVVTVEIAEGHETEPSLSVTSRPRAGLRSLKVDASVGLGSQSQWEVGTWPGDIRAVAVYEDGREFTLAGVGNSRLRSELAAFLPSLRADLEK